MSEHTIGKLVYQENADEYTHIARFDGGRFFVQLSQEKSGVTKANCRRLVAAWNLCEGIPTEQIEGLDLRRLLAERVELLAACKAYIAWEHAQLAGEGNEFDRLRMLADAGSLMSAAVAKAEGKNP